MTFQFAHRVRWPTKTELGDAGIWLALTIFFGLLPLWGGVLLRFAFEREFKLADFVIHGEFALYTASIMSGTFYLCCRDRFRTFPLFPFRPYFLVVSVLLIAWSALISGGMFLGNAPSGGRVAWLTVPPFLVGLVASVLAILFESQLYVPDPHTADGEEIEELTKRVKKRRKAN
jgi:hypothetical protein